jgi:hypothetical protein
LAVPSKASVRPIRSAFELIEGYEGEHPVIFRWLGPIRCRSGYIDWSWRTLCTSRLYPTLVNRASAITS